MIALGFNIKLSSTEVSFMMLSFLMEFLELIAYLTISAMFFFLSENVAMGVFAFLSFRWHFTLHLCSPWFKGIILTVTMSAAFWAELSQTLSWEIYWKALSLFWLQLLPILGFLCLSQCSTLGKKRWSSRQRVSAKKINSA